MIITRTPFRVSFCGGGSDLPAFYEKHGGCVLSTGIQKYMYLSIHPAFDPAETVLKYSRTEQVKDYSEIEHKYFRCVLERFGLKGVEITSTADVPAGTGMGSSSSFTVGLLHVLYSYTGKFVSRERLAEEACRTEMIDLGQPIGKQDQYAAAFGGLNFYSFHRDGSVTVEPVIMRGESFEKLERNLMLFYTGSVHSASEILKEQGKNVTEGEREQGQLRMCQMTRDLREAFQNNSVDTLGEILDEGWAVKRTLASGISSPAIDEYYDRAKKLGAAGGKLLGAGGGGFLLLYVPEKEQGRLRRGLQLQEMSFGMDRQGSSVIYVGQKLRR